MKSVRTTITRQSNSIQNRQHVTRDSLCYHVFTKVLRLLVRSEGILLSKNEVFLFSCWLFLFLFLFGVFVLVIPGRAAWSCCLVVLPGRAAWSCCLVVLPGRAAWSSGRAAWSCCLVVLPSRAAWSWSCCLVRLGPVWSGLVCLGLVWFVSWWFLFPRFNNVRRQIAAGRGNLVYFSSKCVI
jgi:hypothetical protein